MYTMVACLRWSVQYPDHCRLNYNWVVVILSQQLIDTMEILGDHKYKLIIIINCLNIYIRLSLSMTVTVHPKLHEALYLHISLIKFMMLRSMFTC